MTVTPAERIGGWLLAPLAWLLVSLLGTLFVVVRFITVLLTPEIVAVLNAQSTGDKALWYASFIFAVAMGGYTLWLTVAFFKRRRQVPKHYIIWLLISTLLALKAFAFSPVSDTLALRQLLFPLLAAALIVPYLKRSQRVKKTFVNP
ncbi:DUF2569 domain-containing protein [Pseudescherichia sp.]|uniref:DUF2569 domain-containing protein n=1 Tax=Pseudescherichia sp. TaxID=2055881 RepID=UPI0028A1A17A|nr:DUF2569 domain-containing protein [Pseudescherichia sp.]